MKHGIRFVLLLLIFLLPFGCSKNDGSHAAEKDSSSVWSLRDRYPVTYGTMRHAYTYEKSGQTFYLTVARNKSAAGTSKDPIDTLTKDGLTVSLLESEKIDSDETLTDYTYYACDTDTYRYTVGIELSGFQMQSLLSAEDAIALIQDPYAKINGLTLQKEEWSAYYRLDACNLEISIVPNDGGKAYRALQSTYEERSEGGETYLFSESDQAIAYTNGTDTVHIRQSNRSGKEHVAYSTLSECKALLALLGNN